MKRTRSSEGQIFGVLKEAEAGAKTADLARRHGVSEATIYNWKKTHRGKPGMIASDNGTECRPGVVRSDRG